MATVKISDLPIITQINLDTTQTILPVVDISTDETAQITVRTLADGLYHNDALKVGPNEILLANTIAQFSGNSETFLQTNLQNLNANGSADYVATADIGTNANNYIDIGINNSNFNDPDYSSMKRLDGYLYTSGSLDNSADGNLVIGTASTGANIVFIAGGTTEANVVAKITKFGITLNNAGRLEFTDGSIQTVAAASAALTQFAANTANSASANTIIIQGVNVTQNNNITAVNNYAQSGFATANDANGMAVGAYNTANGANGLAAGAYNTANNAFSLSVDAFELANGANGMAVSAYSTANGANGLAAGAYNTANGANGLAVSAYSTANGANGLAAGAYNTANGANGLAQSAFNTANGANGLAAGAYNTANGANGLAAGAFIKANNAIANTFAITVNNSFYIPGTLVVDGIVYANGATYVANTMSIPTTYSSPQTNITLNYQQANIVKTNITNDLVVSHTNFVLGKQIDLFVYNDSALTQTITHGVPANNSTTKGTTIKVGPYSTKHLKYFTINSDLANTYVIESVNEYLAVGDFTATGNITSTGGTVSTGNLSVGGTTMMIGNMTSNGTSNLVGNVIMSGTATIEGFFNVNNSTFSANTAMMRMTASDNYAVVSPSNSYYMLHITGKSNNVTRVVLDSFGANTYSLVSGRMGRGSAAAPAAVANNDVMMRITGNGYTGTQFPSSSPSKIDFVASENFSDTNRGARIEFWNTPTGSNTIQKIASFNADTIQFSGAVYPQKGFIWSPNVYPNAQTAITIDFANNSLIRAQTATGLVVSFVNHTAGKEVHAWITNTAGTNQTFTHGCSAINSTVNSTTYAIPATSSIFVKYFCLDGTLANTFCAITHP